MFDLTDIDSFKAYFSGIADNLIALEGFIFGDDQVALNSAKSWKGIRLWLDPNPSASVQDNLSDNFLQQRQGALWIGGPVIGNSFESRDNLYKQSEAIVKDVISKMLKDKSEFVLLTGFSSYKFGRADYELGSSKMVGCRLEFTYTDPSGFAYDESKWTNP